MDAVQYIYPPRFGRYIRSLAADETAKAKAAEWLADWTAGRITHENIEINSCDIQFDGYTPTGVKTFDEQRARSSGFSSGNVSSNVQTSTLVPSRFFVNNGGVVNFPEGEAQESSLKWIRNSGIPRSHEVVATVLAANDEPTSSDASVACVYLLHHYHGPKHDRKRIDHGWIVTDKQGQLLNRFDLSNSATSKKILDQAEYVFTGMNSDSVPLLKLVDNQVIFVDPDVQSLADEIAEQRTQRPRERG